ncbi:MAG: exonuclease domain-containing protein [Lachnospiraceae bacterium]|nr:exonuclease domain-containing protein [Lachnospiraceae bacterium]
MNYIVLDLEFNQPYNFKSGNRTVLEPKLPFEIIQVGAVKLDDDFNITERFNYFIKPQIYKRIHPIVERLTGITLDRLNNSDGFLCAYEAFVNFIGNDEAILCSWGTDDIKSLFRNIIYHKCDQNKITKKYINIQSFATKHLNFEAGNSIGLKNAVELLNIPEESQFHDALNDAYYTALVFQLVKPENLEPLTFTPADLEPKKSSATRLNTRALINYFEKSLERELSTEEIAMIKTAYKFGKKNTYEIPNKKSIKNDTTQN